MLQIIIPAEEMSEFAKTAELMAQIKGSEITALHEWKIPCGSGIQLTIKLEGPVGMKIKEEFFEQAIRLLEVAKDGVAKWEGR